MTNENIGHAENIVLKIRIGQGATRDLRGDFINVAPRKIQGLNRHKPTGGIAADEVFRDFNPEVSQEIDSLEVAQIFTGFRANERNSGSFPLPPMPTSQNGNDGGGCEKLHGRDVDHDSGMPPSEDRFPAMSLARRRAFASERVPEPNPKFPFVLPYRTLHGNGVGKLRAGLHPLPDGLTGNASQSCRITKSGPPS